ncbi:Mu-like prophage major head subunit gpT family protein [Maritalea myrionectae]|uniref:Mu-like prophage major head subunit gpT family protein n=1 Tax=Maritalea myrionectae TaxID=454601 RepID=UPI00040D15AF|nr:Mu-like prophage major head subunit gpT family protein [Maritalea myrionectae]
MGAAAQYKAISSQAVIAMMMSRLDTGSTSWVDECAMKVSSNEASEDYGWLGAVPAMSEFVNSRSPAEIKEYSFSLANKDFDNSITFKKKDMRRDKTGMIRLRVNDLVSRAEDLPASLISKLIMNGASSPCYDGQYFFDTDHPTKGGVQSNSISVTAATGTSPTVSEFEDAVLKAIEAILGFKDEHGEPINQSASQFTIQVPIAMMGAALKAVNAVLGEGGKSAVLPSLQGEFQIKIVPNARLTWSDSFVLYRTDSEVKPFIIQEEEPIEPWAIGDGTEHEVKEKEHLYGVDWAGNVGYGQWSGAVKVTFT